MKFVIFQACPRFFYNFCLLSVFLSGIPSRAIVPSINLSSCVASSDGKVFFAATNQENLGAHALVVGNSEMSEVKPLMAQRAVVNGLRVERNPLYNATISSMGLIEELDMFKRISGYKPVVALADEPAIYTVERYGVIEEEKKDSAVPAPTELLGVSSVKDSVGERAGRIISLKALSSQPATIFAAVKGREGFWGEKGSGIAVFEARTEERPLTEQEKKEWQEREQKEKEVKETNNEPFIEMPAPATKKVVVLKQLDVTGRVLDDNSAVCATPLNISCDALKVGEDLSALGDVVDMHWDKYFGRLYIALQPTAGAGKGAGVRSIVVGRLEVFQEVDQVALKRQREEKKARNDQEAEEKEEESQPKKRCAALRLFPLLPVSACGDPQESIVGACGKGVSLSAHSVRTMATSTSLHYLIVQGGVGKAADTRRSIYALPLKSSALENKLISSQLQKLCTELEKQKGEKKEEISQQEKHIAALEHARYCVDAAHGTLANAFDDPTAADCFYDAAPYRFSSRSFSRFAYTPQDIPSAQNAAAMVGGGPLLAGDIEAVCVRGDAVFATVCTPAEGQQPGVFSSQALFDHTGKVKGWTHWARATAAIAADSRCMGVRAVAFDSTGQSLQVAGDAHKTSKFAYSKWKNNSKKADNFAHFLNADLKSLGAVSGLIDFPAGMTPTLTDCSLFAALHARSVTLAQVGVMAGGVIQPAAGDWRSGEHVVSFTDSDLAQVGPLTNAEIISYKKSGVLCVAGVGGIAVLVDDRAKGWHNLKNLSQLPVDLKWKKISSWPFISKLIYDDGFLYVLSDAELRRIDVAQLDLAACIKDPAQLDSCTVSLAHSQASRSFGRRCHFTDCIVSEKIALLATNKGLLRSGDGKDVRTSAHESQIEWTPVSLPEPLGVVAQLVPLSVTGRSQDIARFGGGMVYALDVNYAHDKGHLVRLSVADAQKVEVTTDTVRLLPDRFFKDSNAPVVDFEGCKDLFATDGAAYLAARGRDGEQGASVQALSAGIKASSRRAAKNAVSLPIDLSDVHDVFCAVRSNALGAWFIATDQGVYSNEVHA